MLYEKTSKTWKWWIAQQCPSGYKWVPKTKMKWMPKVRNETVKKRVSFAIDNIVQLILFIVDFGCTKHMTGNLTLLCNFVEKYMGTVRFGNDQFALILGYRDLVQGNITINRVYYFEGLNHNLFSVGQFCDADLEVAFWKSTCFVRDLQGNDLLTGNRGFDLYTISLQETTSSTPLCLMAKASPTEAWLWHRRLFHLNFDYINLLSKKDVVIGLPKLKYVTDQLCSSCEVSKAKRSSFKTKTVPSSKGQNFNQQPRNWPPSMSSRVSNRTVNTAEPPRNQKSFLKSKDLACPTCKKCIYSANHDECILKYLSQVNSRASAQKKHAQSHKTTKRYIPVEKKSDSKNHGRQIPIGQRFSPNKSSNVYLKTTPPRSGLTWKPTGRIFTQVGLKWIPIRKSVETRYNTNDSASPLGKKTHNPNTTICANSSSLSA
ncbi:retrovirus-related pol polyprotein from transposon TNT 1-94, partial [Tanacetum coccineum]